MSDHGIASEDADNASKPKHSIIAWTCAGVAIGWIAHVFLRMNTARGVFVSLFIGAVAAFFGGHVLGPMLGSELSETSDISVVTLLIATGSALVFLKLTDATYELWGP